MAKSSRLGAKGSFVIKERKIKSFDCVSSQALRLLCYFGGAITVELCSTVKCALWGLRGRTPLQAHEKNNTPPCANALTSSDFFFIAPNEALRLLLFAGHSMISCRTRSGIAAPYMEDHQGVNHL